MQVEYIYADGESSQRLPASPYPADVTCEKCLVALDELIESNLVEVRDGGFLFDLASPKYYGDPMFADNVEEYDPV